MIICGQITKILLIVFKQILIQII